MPGHYSSPLVARSLASAQAERLGGLVAAATGGDPLAWAELFRRFTRRIATVARCHRFTSHEADDIVQDTWLRALEHLGGLRDPESVAGWLNTTARRECLRHISINQREAKARRALESELVEPTAFDVLDGHERSTALARALERVTEREQALMRVLLADPEPTYAEVSLALGMPIGSIGPTRGRAIARLRDDDELAAAVLD
ncbi:RNA polymerase sigma factor [Solirubrobacter soli]|uniref:RNA polymerase sigma factor n=1 Tax=Solirubrobacter soli TaxID=363832 RepID=UPI00041B41D1|nr:sigma-70 family RNA polymerase sigma factor [Solirubrobacter soli]